jgi:hypothetical protein
MTSGSIINVDATTFLYETPPIPDRSTSQQTEITHAPQLTPTERQKLPRPSESSVSQAPHQTRMTDFF